jgi:hypothetical protein
VSTVQPPEAASVIHVPAVPFLRCTNLCLKFSSLALTVEPILFFLLPVLGRPAALFPREREVQQLSPLIFPLLLLSAVDNRRQNVCRRFAAHFGKPNVSA